MKILIVAATPFEILPLSNYLQSEYDNLGQQHFQKGDLQVQLLITGVGQMLTAFAMGTVLSNKPYDFLLNAGVAGAFNRTLQLGQVVNVVSEQFGDLGAENKDGTFLNIHQMELLPPNQLPFQNGQLTNPSAIDFQFLPQVHGLTVNKVHGNQSSIDSIMQQYQVDIESMEGAAFFYAALLSEIPFLEIRAISNYVEPRNRDNWRLSEAIESLNSTLIELVKTFE